MQLTSTLGLAAVLALGLAAAPAQAVIVGTPGGPNPSGFPFGANPGGRYQQIFDASLFTGGAISITSLSFFSSTSPTAPLASGPYTLSLSTTTRGIDDLEALRGTNVNATDAQVFDSNVGADSTTVFAGLLPNISSGRLTFTLTTAFNYLPSAGQLLLDVQSAVSTGPSVVLDLDEQALISRLFLAGTALTSAPNGLVTEIGVPEPASMALLGAGLMGLVGLRRRRSV